MRPILNSTAMRVVGLLAIVLLLAVLPPGSAGGQEPETRLQGEYAVTIATEDVPPELIGGASLIGRWRITFGEDGEYVLGRQDVGTLVRGRFQLDGDRLILGGETGVVACETDPEQDAAATYAWEITDGRLLLMAIEEPCARRRLLLTTRALSPFVACPPPDAHRAKPAAGASVSGAPVGSFSPASEIDSLLKQMSECWATRQPERFLQLLSAEYRAAQTPEDEDGERRFVLNMAAPIVWELVDEVEVIDGTHVTAPVRQTLGDSVDTVHYAFVYEDGSWRWDGAVDPP